MTTLLVGFDSAWTAANSGAIVGLLHSADGTYRELGPPRVANFTEAEQHIVAWQREFEPHTTLVLLDQPTIVKNAVGQRPVEHLVASPVSRRYGGMQPANTGRSEMFGLNAPIWPFLQHFGGPTNLSVTLPRALVVETYPVLVLIALGWTMTDIRRAGRLPKYNPARRKTFAASDWQYVCHKTAGALRAFGIVGLADWLDCISACDKPRKQDQDGLDACICLLVALCLNAGEECLVVGDFNTGYILVPFGETLHNELLVRCELTKRDPAEWVRTFRNVNPRPPSTN